MNHTKGVEQLITQIDAQSTPILVDVEVWPEGEYRKCHDTVAHRASIDGGRVVVGWMIVERPDYVMAWSHAVWEGPDGLLRDITPMSTELTMSHILFLPDSRLPLDGSSSAPNEFWWSPGRKDVACLIKAWRMADHIRPHLSGPISNELQELIDRYNGFILAFDSFVTEGRALDSPCPCSSGLSFDRCHAITMDDEIRRDKDELVRLGY